jgi:hypothetical protein
MEALPGSIMSTDRIDLQQITLTRVGYIDVPIPPEVAGLTADDFASIPWRAPIWTEGDQLRAGAAAWFADVDSARLVFDPVQAADDVLRADQETERAQQSAIADLFADAEFPRESVDCLVLTHIEGVGMVAWRNDDGSWSPFFPNARILVSDVALREFLASESDGEGDLQYEAWHALIDQGVVDSYADGEVIAPGVRAQVTGGHCAGHAIVHFGGADDGAEATLLGHLAVSPVHLATGECPPQHIDPAAVEALLRGFTADGRTLVGPLWPAPGFGRWVDGGFVAGR